MKSILRKSLILSLSAVAIFALAPTSLMADKPDSPPGKPETTPPSSPPGNPNQTPPGQNIVPVADAGVPQSVIPIVTVPLDGSGSSDANDDSLTFSWSFTSVPSGSSALLSDDTAPKPTFVADIVGQYVLALEVSDGQSSSTDSVTITAGFIMHNDTAYLPVENTITDRVWLDRNLGASQVCTVSDDPLCYGDYYQWGRNYDGHEKRDSDTNTTQADNVTNAGSQFIIEHFDWVSVDADDFEGSLRSENWLSTDGSSICPPGFSVPTEVELKEEQKSWGNPNSDFVYDANATVAFETSLKWGVTGHRYYWDGNIVSAESGAYWSSTPAFHDDNPRAAFMRIHPGSTDFVIAPRTNGCPVRCIQDQP